MEKFLISFSNTVKLRFQNIGFRSACNAVHVYIEYIDTTTSLLKSIALKEIDNVAAIAGPLPQDGLFDLIPHHQTPEKKSEAI